MKNKIIIEGFWETGKTTLVESFKDDNYFVIYEPKYLSKSIPQENVDNKKLQYFNKLC